MLRHALGLPSLRQSRSDSARPERSCRAPSILLQHATLLTGLAATGLFMLPSLAAKTLLVPQQTAEKKRSAADAKAYKAWGLLEKDGRWQRMADLEQQDKGMVQHPETGRWIAKDDLQKAQADKFPVGEKDDIKWVSEAEANEAHGDWSSPWILLGDNIELRTTYDLKDAKNILNEAESAVSYVRNILWDPTMPLPKRVLIFAFSGSESYSSFGNRFDASGFSSHGAFLVADDEQGKKKKKKKSKKSSEQEQPVALYYGAKDWGPYYLKHAVGLGIAAELLLPLGVPPRHWVLSGCGSYVSRWSNKASWTHFGKQYLAKGGIRNLKSFPKSFAINGDMSAADVDWTLYQAGILIAYVAKNPDKKTQAAWDKLRTAIRLRDKKTEKILSQFESKIVKRQKDLRHFLEKLVAG